MGKGYVYKFCGGYFCFFIFCFVEIDTVFCVWDKINLQRNQKFNSWRDKLQAKSAVPGAFCILKGRLHYLMPKWVHLCCSLGAEMSYSNNKYRKGKSITFVTGPWFDKVCQGLVIMMGSLMVPAFTAGPELQSVLRWSCTTGGVWWFRQHFSAAVGNPVCIPHFINRKTTHAHHWRWILHSGASITSKLQMSLVIIVQCRPC